MPATKKRINISMESGLEKMLSGIAKRDHVPQATKATELLRIAIEIEEDQAWANFAEKRDKKDARFVSHKKAWA